MEIACEDADLPVAIRVGQIGRAQHRREVRAFRVVGQCTQKALDDACQYLAGRLASEGRGQHMRRIGAPMQEA